MWVWKDNKQEAVNKKDEEWISGTLIAQFKRNIAPIRSLFVNDNDKIDNFELISLSSANTIRKLSIKKSKTFLEDLIKQSIIQSCEIDNSQDMCKKKQDK